MGTDDEIERASRDELRFPRMSKMYDDITQAYFSDASLETAELGDKFFRLDIHGRGGGRVPPP